MANTFFPVENQVVFGEYMFFQFSLGLDIVLNILHLQLEGLLERSVTNRLQWVSLQVVMY